MASEAQSAQPQVALAGKREQKEKITLYWILWLLEELGLEYDLKVYMRGKDMLAPKELKEVHPLGKSPVLTIQSAASVASGTGKPVVIAESGLIVEYLLDHYGQHMIPRRYAAAAGESEGATSEGLPGTETEEWMRYKYYMHYAEGSLMPFMVLALIMNQIRNAPVPFFLKPITRGIANRIDGSFLDRNLKANVAFLEDQLATSPGGGEWFAGKQLTGADIMMIFPLDAGRDRAGITKEKCPNIMRWIEQVKGREAFKRATSKIEEATGQPYASKL